MIEPVTDRARRVASLSQRLRVLHVELAEVPAEMRAEQLQDEVQRALSQMQPGDREGFLTDLLAAFPTWADGVGGGVNGSAVPSGGGMGSGSAKPAKVPTDPIELADLLINATINLPESEKAKVRERLRIGGLIEEPVAAAAPAAGAASVGGAVGGAVGATVFGGKPASSINLPPVPAPSSVSVGPVAGGAMGELKRAVGLGGDVVVDAGRAVELAAVLAEFTLKLEPWACTYWQNLAPDAKNGVPAVLKTEVPRFLQGDEGVGKEAMGRSLYKLRSLVSLLMRGVLEAGKQFGKDHLKTYAPGEIEKVAGPGTIMKPTGVKCWEQYVKLMEGVDAGSLEKRLRQLIAKDVDAGLSQVIK